MQPRRFKCRKNLTKRARGLFFEPLESRLLLDAAGPRIIDITPTEVRNADFDHLDVTFNEAINSQTFTPSDVSITGLAGPIDVSSVEPLDGTNYRIHFAALTTRGTYAVTVGPEIEDLDGNLMDQNNDGSNGDPTNDVYRTSVVYVVADVIFSSNVTISESDTTYDGHDILIAGATVAIDGPHSFGSAPLINGAVLTHTANTATATHKLDLTVTEQVIVDATSQIDVSGKGYLAGSHDGQHDGGRRDGQQWWQLRGAGRRVRAARRMRCTATTRIRMTGAVGVERSLRRELLVAVWCD